ncbi:Leucine-rich repeat receptor-like serine/threonine/tyrosine-protein kinase SOBIR1 [Linum grandiflorum]
MSPEIGRLSELKELSLRNNRLVDRIPPELVNCKKLHTLDLSSNQFSGDVPSIVNLRFLNLSSNNFSGDLSFLQHFPNLETLSLSNNLFTGQIPDSIRSLCNLRSFEFSGYNRLTSSKSYLERYKFAEDEPGSVSVSFSGPISAAVGSISGSVFCVMFMLVLAAVRDGGKDSGPAIFIPVIKNLRLPIPSSHLLNFISSSSTSSLAGTLPDSIGDLSSLRVLVISHHRFSCEIPTSLSDLRSMEVLELQGNNFSVYY